MFQSPLVSPRTLGLVTSVVLGLLSSSPAVFAETAAALPGNEGGSALPLVAELSDGRVLDLPELDASVPRPSDFLGYPLGSRFTRYDRVLAYFERLAAASPRVRLWQYGTSYEGRPLVLAAISTPDNLRDLEALRRQHLKLADPGSLSAPERDRLVKDTPAVVWLAYGVNGNESSSTEVSMAAAYLFAAAQGDWPRLLQKTILLVDPLVNPDGRERYVAGFEQRRGALASPDRASAEHFEPWPGGRQNHYLIDLNRDWSWATQKETRDRIVAYRQWEPQVYADFHEMSVESTYFFPPPAAPVHPGLDRRTLAWLETFGKANGQAFDQQGWPYFKTETYDLFYPGYGDSYPAFRGAVGMTYEVGGGGRAGSVSILQDGTPVTLADRLARHLTTSLATVRTAAVGANKLNADFVAARTDAASAGPVYLLDGGGGESAALADLLSFHGVDVEVLESAVTVAARSLQAKANEIPVERSFPRGTLVVSAAQPLGNLVRALLETAPELGAGFLARQREKLERNESTEFYDVTAWSLPLAFGVDGWVADLESVRPLTGQRVAWRSRAGGLSGEGKVGFLVPPQGYAGQRLASQLLAEGLELRVALAGFELGGRAYPAGTLFVPRRGNPDNLAERLGRALTEVGAEARGIDSTYVTSGVSLGSNQVPSLRQPRVGVLAGEGVSPTSFGFAWHLLDQQIRLPVLRVEGNTLGSVDLARFDVLVLPDGSYGRTLGGDTGSAVARWVREGGVLVAIDGAAAWLKDQELTAIKPWTAPEEGEGPKDPESDGSPTFLERSPVETPGAIVATRGTPGHALLAGLGRPPVALVNGTTVLLPTRDPQQDVLTIGSENFTLGGVMWTEAESRLAGSLLVGMERKGRGLVVTFAQEPNFRLFWRGTSTIFLNAVLLGPNLAAGRGL
ncbi:MAG: M14 family zinc carboxypeptidase [Thermoanaerobaculia bacterium]|nr:M14 family zinc carboxypeptidase [Thermoanaerobaculia bacterium]